MPDQPSAIIDQLWEKYDADISVETTSNMNHQNQYLMTVDTRLVVRVDMSELLAWRDWLACQATVFKLA